MIGTNLSNFCKNRFLQENVVQNLSFLRISFIFEIFADTLEQGKNVTNFNL